jgi:AcrR family transcriptional regulator
VGTTTNRIAELAGISVGSLYQYFPSKEAIMGALVERHVSEVLAALESRRAPSGRAPFATVARAAVAAVLRAHAHDPERQRVMHAELPRTGRLPLVRETESRLAAAVRLLVSAHRAELRVRDLDLRAFVLVHLVEGLAHAALAHRPELLASRAFEAAIVDAVLGCVGAQRTRARGSVRARRAGRGRP